jgi:hypothetical protein
MSLILHCDGAFINPFSDKQSKSLNKLSRFCKVFTNTGKHRKRWRKFRPTTGFKHIIFQVYMSTSTLGYLAFGICLQQAAGVGN